MKNWRGQTGEDPEGYVWINLFLNLCKIIHANK
jgi:hypothetical protein